MVIFPRSSVVIGNLNSYYIFLSKLLEHYQGFLNSGCIYFKSTSSEGVIFFDDENIINAVLIEKNKIIKEQEAVDTLIENSDSKNFSITIFDIPQDLITYWANLFESVVIKKCEINSLSEMETLFIECKKDKITGSIEIKDQNGNDYILFLLAGHIFLSTSKEKKYDLNESSYVLGILNDKFNSIENFKLVTTVKSTSLIQKVFSNRFKSSTIIKEKQDKPEVVDKPLKFIDMLQNLMVIYEKFLNHKKSSDYFDKLLKKKFIEKVDKFIFLDPFAAEFSYNRGKINFIGSESHQVLAESLIECLNEICFENDMKNWLKKHLTSFEEKYSHELSKLNVKILYN